MLSCSALWQQKQSKASIEELCGGRKNFIAPGKRGGLPEHGRNGTVLFFAKLDGVFYRRIVELAAEAIEQFELDPDCGRFCGAFARANHFQRFDLLPLLLQDGDYVGGGAGSERQQHEFHRAGRFVRRAVGIDGYRVPGRANGYKFLFANPLHGSGLHAASWEKDSRTRTWKRVAGISTWPSIRFYFELRGPAGSLNSAWQE